ncbi:MAG: VWA domain-containing protein [Deltaproteobacteria bacterium]|nr:VWA domain-containing protein [Deltaproteobacteria bacterium]
MTFTFGFPWAFLLLIPLALLVGWRVTRERKLLAPVIAASSELWAGVRATWRVRLRFVPPLLRALALTALVVAVARPQSGRTYDVTEGEGIDIVLALDISGSMSALDFEPHDRLQVAKATIRRFIEGRKVDRIGLVLFAGKAFTQAPLTLDYGMILQFLDRAEVGLIDDGTAIGMALVTATNRLRDSTAKSKVVVLLTDGDNNAGQVDPRTAANLAAGVGVRVHTIGVGSNGPVYVPVKDPLLGRRLVRQNFKLDEETLRAIADETGGDYFRATDAASLARVFERIDTMEKSPYEIKTFTDFTERYPIPLALAFAFALAEILLAGTVFRRVF